MPEPNVCGRCQQPLRPHEAISVADVGLRCYSCFNEETAALMGVDFDNTPLQPVTVSDADGDDHTSSSGRCSSGPVMLSMPASDCQTGRRDTSSRSSATMRPPCGPLQIAVRPDSARAGCPPRRTGELGWRITDARHLVGRIVWDTDRAGEVPRLVVDGRPFTWDQVGRMLMAFEGFTLRAVVDDTIELVGGPLMDEEDTSRFEQS